MRVRIYRPVKTATQSGVAKTRSWVVEFESESPSVPEPLMGWSSSNDTLKQVKLKFDSEEDAVEYARRNGYGYRIEKPMERSHQKKSYADNFAFTRREPWTH